MFNYYFLDDHVLEAKEMVKFVRLLGKESRKKAHSERVGGKGKALDIKKKKNFLAFFFIC